MRDLLKILAAGSLLTVYALVVPALVEGAPDARRRPGAVMVAQAPGPFLPAGAPRALRSL
jgi:hypothetical protein